MRIDRLTVQNFRCFENNTWDFTPHFNVLIGDNGTGKTAVLEALKIALGAYIAGFPGRRFERIEARDIRLVRGGTEEQPTSDPVTPVHIRATGQVNGQQVEWRRSVLEGTGNKGNSSRLRAIADSLTQQIHARQEPLLPIVAYYPARRLWSEGLTAGTLLILTGIAKNGRDLVPSPQVSPPPSRLEGYSSALSAQANSKNVVKWFTRLTLSALQKGVPNSTLDAVRNAGIRCLPDWDDVYYDPLTDAITVSNKTQVLPANLLSDGQRNILFLALDIAYRCALLNPSLRNRAASETPGVVLIDEIDLHLHPEWQRHIVNNLREVFPKIQFIATTHSPLVIQSLRPGEVIDLNGGFPQDYYKQSVEEILTGSMGLDETRRDEKFVEMKQVAEEYFLLLEENQGADNGKAEELRERLDKLTLPYHENPAYIAFRNFLEQRRLVAVGNC